MGKIQHLLTGDDRDPRIELGEIFGVSVPTHGGVQPEALAWARTIVDPASVSMVEAIRQLRQAQPKLGLKSATYLANRLYA